MQNNKVTKCSNKAQLNKIVFCFSALLSFTIGCFSIFYPDQSNIYITSINNFIQYHFASYYMLLMSICLMLALFLIMSKYGDIKLGDKDQEPEYNFLAWSFMLFSAGIGIAIIYYGCYEPVEHFFHPPISLPDKALNAQNAITISFLHWGLHGWALYAILGTILAYFSYVKKQPLEIRTPLSILFKNNNMPHWLGNIIDSITVAATLIAMVTNLGFGALVIKGGLYEIFGAQHSIINLTNLLIIMTVITMIIASLPIEDGLGVIAKFNIYALCILLIYVLVCGHSTHLCDAIIQNSGDYINNLLHLSSNMYLYQNAKNWQGAWTIFYWGWWISWAPFVGLFIAKISRGRTIRQLVSATIILPMSFTLLWICILGNSSLYIIIIEHGEKLANAILSHPETGIYEFFKYMPYAKLLIILTTIISFILFISPVDSGCLVISELCMNPPHRINKNTEQVNITPSLWLKIFWCAIGGFFTIALFICGNFQAMQSAAVIFALPFSVIILAYIIAFFRAANQKH